MLTSENDSRLANAETSSTCRLNREHKRLGLNPNLSHSTESDRPRRSFHPRTLYDASAPISSSKIAIKRKRTKKHKHHHRHRSNRANDLDHDSETPQVNPIFVWVKQDDTKIVQVLCEDYDYRNRIRLTKTASGWRSIPLTESLEKRWHPNDSSQTLVNQVAFDNSQTDNLSSCPDAASCLCKDLEEPIAMGLEESSMVVTSCDERECSLKQSITDSSIRVLDHLSEMKNNLDNQNTSHNASILQLKSMETEDAENATRLVPVTKSDTDCKSAEISSCANEHSKDTFVNDRTAVSEFIGSHTEIISESNESNNYLQTVKELHYSNVNQQFSTKKPDIKDVNNGDTHSSMPDNTVHQLCSEKIPLDSFVEIKPENLDTNYEFVDDSHQPVLLRTPLCQTLKTSKAAINRRSVPNLKKQAHFEDLKFEPLPAHIQSITPQPHVTISDEFSQNEPLYLGTGGRDKLTPKTTPLPLPTIACRKHPYSEKESSDKNTSKKSRLLDLLTNHVPEQEKIQSDPLEQLKDVLSNPKYMVPDPLLVPKARLSALVTCPGKEIPRLLSQRAHDLSYFSILSDPDVLVVSLSHLQSLLRKPINEEEILKYQKQTEEIRSRLREQCFNNYDSMAVTNWNPCYWLPNLQPSDIGDCGRSLPAHYLSMLNLGFATSATKCCSDKTLLSSPTGNNTLTQYQKEAVLWQELAALHQMSAASQYDHFNNNIAGGYDLSKEECGMMWNQDACTNYKCCQTASTNAAINPKGNLCSQSSKLSFPFLPPSLAYSAPTSCELANRPQLYDQLLDNFCNFTKVDKAECKTDGQETRYPESDPLYSLLHGASVKQSSKTEEKEERENRPPAKEIKSEKSSRPLVPKIKVRKHLVDPNQHPARLLNPDVNPFQAANGSAPDGPYLWHPLFNSNAQRSKLKWAIPVTSSSH